MAEIENNVENNEKIEQVNGSKKNWLTTLILCWFLGFLGVHRLYAGKLGSGFLMAYGTAVAACSDARVASMGRFGNPDIVIFYIGCNDWGSSNSPVADYGTWTVNDPVVDDSGYSSTQTLNDFGAAYSLMLAKTHRAYPHAKLYCCTIMDELLRDDDKQYPPINARGVSNYTWNAKIKDITEALGASCINVHDCGVNCFNIIYYCTDDTGSQGTALHPNKAGMALIAQKVISALIAE